MGLQKKTKVLCTKNLFIISSLKKKQEKHYATSSRQSLENNINENNQGSLNTFHTKHTLISIR